VDARALVVAARLEEARAKRSAAKGAGGDKRAKGKKPAEMRMAADERAEVKRMLREMQRAVAAGEMGAAEAAEGMRELHIALGAEGVEELLDSAVD
jgi:hypothetical protein